MQLIVTCAGCGAKYRGESGPKKFRCAACSNLFTFPDQPKAPSAGTILCSNCWTETVPTEKLKTCGFCSQRVSPRYGGLASEDKQVKVKQPSVRNDPNLVKAVTRPDQSGVDVMTNSGGAGLNTSNQFASNEWREIGGDMKPDLPDPKKTQAFELMAELKKELEGEMQGVLESMNKMQENEEQIRQSGINRLPDSLSQPPDENEHQSEPPQQSEAPASVTTASSISPRPDDIAKLSNRDSQVIKNDEAHANALADANGLEQKPPVSDGPPPPKRSSMRAVSTADTIRELQAKIEEMTSLMAADQRAKEQLLDERSQLEHFWQESDAKVHELTAKLEAQAAEHAAATPPSATAPAHDTAEHAARLAELQYQLDSERQVKDALQREHDQLQEAHTDLNLKFVDLASKPSASATEQDGPANSLKSSEHYDDSQQELEARVADLETRLGNEKKTKESLIKERDMLSDDHRELQARIADLESRLNSERGEKQNISAKHDEHLDARNELDAKVAHLESRLNSEREAKEAASQQRDKLHDVRLELEARTADLTRRHATEKEAKERVLKEKNDMANEHRELNAKMADFRTRLKSEQDIKENVRKERDEALARADAAEARVEKSEAETMRLRKGINAQLEKFAAEYNTIFKQMAERTNDLAAHAATTRKRLDETLQHHGNKIEVDAADLKAKLEQEGAEIGVRLKKLMQENDGRGSARLAAQSGRFPPNSAPPTAPNSGSGSGAGSATSTSSSTGAGTGSYAANTSANPVAQTQLPAPTPSGAYNSAPSESYKVNTAGADGASLESIEASPTAEQLALVAEHLPESARAEVPSESGSGVDVLDKSSGTFWAKVFKRPQTKT